MKIKENVTVFVCEFCKKKLFRRHAMVKHEKFCGAKPENQPACSCCAFLEEMEVSIETCGEYGGIRKSKGFRCTKLQKTLYPLKVVRLGLLERYPETFEDQELMPSDCDEFKFPHQVTNY